MTEDTLDFLHNFFGQIGEGSINDQMMEYSYVFPEKGVEEYVDEVCSIPFADYIEHLRLHPFSTNITSDDVTQLSSLTNCEIGLCKALHGVRRPLTSEDVGILLQDDGIIRDSRANIKYGENHAKAALQLGLTQDRYGYWYLSCLGRIFPNLSLEKQKALLCRTLLRNRLYANIFLMLETGDVSIAKLWATANLSESTQLRRRSSVRHFIQLISFQASREGYTFSHKIDFTIGDKEETVQLIPPHQYNETSSSQNVGLYGENYQPDKSLDHYLDCISGLRVNRKGSEVAPHKYVLMMTILNLVSKGIITSNTIVLDGLLEATFNAEWEKYVSKDSPFVPQVKMPYSHMGSEPFWTDNDGVGTIDLALFYYMSQPESFQTIKAHLENLLNYLNYAESGTLVLERNLEFTFFTEGFTILKKYHNLWKSFIGLVPERGGEKRIYIRVEDEEYEVELDNIYQQGTSSELLQVRYAKTDGMAAKMRSLFHDVYDYSVKQREAQTDGKKKPIQLPDDLQVKVFLHTTDSPAHFVFTYCKGAGNIKDLTYYKNQFLQLPNLVQSKELGAKMLIMLWATMDYVHHYPGERDVINRLPLLAVWEALFLKRYNMFFPLKRNSTAFSNPFIHLSETGFWRILDDNDDIVECDCRAMLTYSHLSELYAAVEVDKELMAFFLNKQTVTELENFFRRNIKLLLS